MTLETNKKKADANSGSIVFRRRMCILQKPQKFMSYFA